MNFIAIDFETANHEADSAVSVGLVKYENGIKTDEFYSLIKPPINNGVVSNEDYFLPAFTEIHGLTYDDVKDAPRFHILYEKELKKWLHSGLPLVAHNARFDMNVLNAIFDSMWHPPIEYFDSLAVSRKVFKDAPNHKLTTLAERFGITYDAHNALADAETCAKIVIEAAKACGAKSVEELLKASGENMHSLNPIQVSEPHTVLDYIGLSINAPIVDWKSEK